MSEVKKLTSEELQTVKDIKQEYNTLVFELGELEIKKLQLIETQKVLSNKEAKVANDLTEKYGPGTINIETGEISQ